MKILEFKKKFSLKEISLKNKLLILLAIVLTALTVSVVLLYSFNEEAREWINIYVLRKEIYEDDIATIELEVDKTQYIYAYDRYITILENGKLNIYNSYASNQAELDIAISNPIYATSNNYLVIAESNGQRVYLISDNKILWDQKVEGSISKINVSKTGIVSIITTGTIYKSVIVTYDRQGTELFKTYSASIVVDADISVDGKFLAIAKVNTNGALVKSSVEIIDIEKAIKNDGGNSIKYTYNADSNKMVTNIKYQERGQLVCMYDNAIHMIDGENDTVLVEFNSNTNIADINLKSYVISADEISTGTFSARTDIKLRNIITGAEIVYSVDSSIKEIVSYNTISAVNLGTEVHFINLNGWLEKKYKSAQEAKEIVLGTSVAGIVYRDRIKVVSF